MSLIQLAPLWLIGIFAALLVAAAVQDTIQLKVSNLIVLGVIIAAIAAAVIAGPDISLWKNLLVFALVLALGTPMFAYGKLGGGDVKLLAAAGLWVTLQQALWLIATVFISGGVLALVVISVKISMRRYKPLSKGAKGGLPYAVAIAAGTLLVTAYERQQPLHPNTNPLEFPGLPR